MQARAFWRAVTVDRSNLLEQFFELLRAHEVRFCLIDGQALNAYVDPVVSLDLDVVIASHQLADVEPLLEARFNVERFPHSLNVSGAGSDLRIQIQLDSPIQRVRRTRARPRCAGVAIASRDARGRLARKNLGSSGCDATGQQTPEGSCGYCSFLEGAPDLRSMVPDDVLARLI
jgi:hypothetical protein